ncbi:TetR/AcrR family transcriptional regulator [Cohnella faecalis]|uniref:TetR/AcrR family transcriptional regulator n=1 Tax=Cohnella faecalis TaxID=2315694 RepID=A0A398CVL0_9BACL|nr:TetR/AcrR family transcriptional regulator [Cohnella faecalis]RIE03054.1 TetR/AcrR family transcriptional regulator [Cohnella faecalis]
MRIRLTPERVLEAAADIANNEGLDKVTLAAVAAALGIKTPSLYNHVAGLEDLRMKLAEIGARKLRERLTEAAIGRSGDSALIAVAKAYAAFAGKEPGMYEALNRLPEAPSALFQTESDLILQLLVRLMEHYELNATTTVHAVRGLRSLIHGFASLDALGGFRMSENKDDSLIWAVSTYLKGLEK